MWRCSQHLQALSPACSQSKVTAYKCYVIHNAKGAQGGPSSLWYLCAS